MILRPAVRAIVDTLKELIQETGAAPDELRQEVESSIVAATQSEEEWLSSVNGLLAVILTMLFTMSLIFLLLRLFGRDMGNSPRGWLDVAFALIVIGIAVWAFRLFFPFPPNDAKPDKRSPLEAVRAAWLKLLFGNRL